MKRSRIGAALGYGPRPTAAPASSATGPDGGAEDLFQLDEEDELLLVELANDPTADVEACILAIKSEFRSIVTVKKQKLEYRPAASSSHTVQQVCPVPVVLLTQLKAVLGVKEGNNASYRRQLFELQGRGKIRLCGVPIGELGVLWAEDLLAYCDSMVEGVEAAKRDNNAAAASAGAGTVSQGRSTRLLAVSSYKQLLALSRAKHAVSEDDIREAVTRAIAMAAHSTTSESKAASSGVMAVPLRPASAASSKGDSSTSSSASAAGKSPSPPPLSSSSSSSSSKPTSASVSPSTAAVLASSAATKQQVDAVIAWLLREGFLARDGLAGAVDPSLASSSSSSSSSSSTAGSSIMKTEEHLFSFAAPASGPLWSYIPAGRSELVQRLRMRSHNEMLRDDLLKAKLGRSHLPMLFHLRDALGCGLVEEFTAAGGIGGRGVSSSSSAAGVAGGKRYIKLATGAAVATT